jgi:hypothetical protein
MDIPWWFCDTRARLREAGVTTTALIGALLFFAGVVYMAIAAIRRGRLSDPGRNPGDTTDRTLEPRQGGLGFLGFEANWPGLLLIAAGAVLLLAVGLF